MSHNIEGLYTNDDQSYTMRTTAKRLSELPPATFHPNEGMAGNFFTRETTTSAVTHTDPAHLDAIEQVRKFWASSEKFARYNISHKRGILLAGPPGTGKSSLMRQLVGETYAAGGAALILHRGDISEFRENLTELRTLAPRQPIAAVIEDLDEFMNGSESYLLEILDGGYAVDHVLFLATSNHPEKLSKRLIRPSRFDVCIHVDMPSECTRRAIITGFLGAKHPQLEKYVSELAGKSVADIKEHIISNVILADEVTDVAKEPEAECVARGFANR